MKCLINCRNYLIWAREFEYKKCIKQEEFNYIFDLLPQVTVNGEFKKRKGCILLKKTHLQRQNLDPEQALEVVEYPLKNSMLPDDIAL